MPNRKLNRLASFDYSTAGAYFITICVQDRACVLGEIVDDEMRLSKAGEVAEQCWREIEQHFPQVYLDEYVIMPNHVHGIVYIGQEMREVCVGTRHALSLQAHTSPQSLPNLSAIIGSFKSAASKNIHLHTSLASFRWQRSFHDRVIRGEAELHQIREYIIHNPKNWSQDSEFQL